MKRLRDGGPEVQPASPTFTFGYSLGDARYAHLEVPLDLTPEEETTLRGLINSQAFGGFVEKIDKSRERQARDEEDR